MMADLRPANCCFRLHDEGKPYPKSSCTACGKGIATGLGRECTNDAPAHEAVRAAVKSAIMTCHGKGYGIAMSANAERAFVNALLPALSPPPTVGAEDEAVRATILADIQDLPLLDHPTAGAVYCANSVEDTVIGPTKRSLATRPAPAADGQRVKDGRPEGWTEALAISFMAANGHNPEMGMFAKSFNEGAWREIKDEWPEFVEFASARIRACLATDKEGA